MKRDIVVIGASAGGIQALQTIMAGLPEGFLASIFVVVHSSPDSPGVLADILQRAGPLPALTVRARERIQRGCIYVAAPDFHLIVEDGFVDAGRGPRENRFRPAVDPLFRSAAMTYGPRVVGIILSGGLDDGSAGLWAVKQQGGSTIVQDPADALVASMPLNAMRYVEVDHCVPAAQIPALLQRLANESTPRGGTTVSKELKTEVEIARGHEPLEAGVEALGQPSIYACPECHGVLLKLKDGSRTRFRCHTGHAYSPLTLLSEFDGRLQEALGNAVRALQEKALLMRHLAEHEEVAHGELGQSLLEGADEAERRARELHQLSMRQPPLEAAEASG